MESQPQNPEVRNNPENFHPCITTKIYIKHGHVAPKYFYYGVLQRNYRKWPLHGHFPIIFL